MVRLGMVLIWGLLVMATKALADDSTIPNRFETAIKSAEEKLALGPEKVNGGWASGFRNDLFRLESLARIYEDYPGAPKKVFTALDKDVKELEGALGKYGEAFDQVGLAKAVKAPPELIEKLEVRLEKKTKALAEDLEHEGWFKRKKNPLRDIRDTLSKVKWLSYEEDRNFVLSATASEAKKVQKAIDNDDYDVNELQTGVHELRRNIRWISQYSSALNGLVLLDDKSCPIEAYRALTTTPWGNLKYVPDGPERDIHPCRIPKCLFVGLSRQIELLGDVKDLGEWQEFLAERLENEEQAWDLMKTHKLWKKLSDNQLKPEAGIPAMAEILVAELKQTGLLGKFHESFKACAQSEKRK